MTPAWLLALVLFGPAEAVAGKYPVHCAEFLRLFPRPPAVRPEPLPSSVDSLCVLIGRGLGSDAAVLFALGDALLARGDRGLAYRAFRRAGRQRPGDAKWQRRVRGRLLDCGTRVPEDVIEAEEREARIWVDAFQSYERMRIARGEDPRDLEAFYARYGRPGDDLRAIVRAHRLSWAGGVAGVAAGLLCLVASRRLRRRAALVPLLMSALLAAGPALAGRTGLFLVGAAASALGGLAVAWRGRRA